MRKKETRLMRRPDRVRGGTAGMTLIELMFACGILAMALAMIFGSLISISVIGRITESRTEAVTVLASVLEEIRALPYERVLTYTPPPNMEGPGVAHAVSVACVSGGAPVGETGDTTGTLPTLALPLAPDFGGSLPNPLEVQVTVRWRESSGHVFQASASVLKEK